MKEKEKKKNKNQRKRMKRRRKEKGERGWCQRWDARGEGDQEADGRGGIIMSTQSNFRILNNPSSSMEQ